MKTEDELVELSRIKYPIGKGKFAEARMGFRAGYKQCEQEQLILHNVSYTRLLKHLETMENYLRGEHCHETNELQKKEDYRLYKETESLIEIIKR